MKKMSCFQPKYIRSKHQGLLLEKIRRASALLAPCTLCPRQCQKDRTRGEKGFCATGERAMVSSFSPHFGEEPQLVGSKGSGTIFFSQCNLKCLFCQNEEISIKGLGQEADDGQIASVMLHLQRIGCHNINLVTPSHVVPQILKAVNIAADLGLKIPLVYNCSGYDSVETLEILNGVIDIYLPDFKFWDPALSKRYCHAGDYPDIARKAIKEMHAQVGDLKVDENGIACSGLLVRHLVMPGAPGETGRILKFLKEKVSARTHVNIMSQYRPVGEAFKFKAISRPLAPEEFRAALHMARQLHLAVVG